MLNNYRVIGKDNDNVDIGFGVKQVQDNEIDPAILTQYLKINDQKGSFPGYGGLPIWYQPDNRAVKELLTPDEKVNTDTREILQDAVHHVDNNGYYYIDQSTVNSMIIGVTRSGKGQKIIMPLLNILARGEEKPTVIIHDPKGELLRDSGNFFKDNGYKIYNFNPSDSSTSSHWNIFETAYQAIVKENADAFDEAIHELVDILVPVDESSYDKYWNDAARNVCEALLRYFLITNTYQIVGEFDDTIRLTLAKKPPVYRDFVTFVTECVSRSNNRQEDLLDRLTLYTLKNYSKFYSGSKEERETFLNNKTSDYLRIEPILTTNGRLACLCQNMEKFGLDPHSFFWYQQIVSAQDMWIKNQPSSEKMRSSILGCMTGPMGQMESTSLFEITSDNEINFPDLLKEPSAIYLQSSVRAPQLNGFLTLFINRFYNYVFDQDRQTQKPGDHRRVHFVIDELPLLNRIPNLSGKLASGLGSQLLFDLAIQDIDQLQNRYGSEASSILANCSNTMFIAGDGKTIDYLESRSAGLITKKELSYKGDNTVYLFRSLVTQKMLGRNQSSLPICCKTMPFYFMIANIQPFSLPRKVEKKGVPSFESIEEYNKKMHMLEVKKGKRALTEELESTDVNIKCVIDTVKKGRKTNPIYDDPIDHGLPMAQGKLSLFDFVQPIGDDGDYVIRPDCKPLISEALNNMNCDIHKLKRRDSVITMYGSVMATYLSDKNEWDISDDLVKLLLCYYATGLVPVEFDNAMAATVGKLQN